jgi:hypothetical protein
MEPARPDHHWQAFWLPCIQTWLCTVVSACLFGAAFGGLITFTVTIASENQPGWVVGLVAVIGVIFGAGIGVISGVVCGLPTALTVASITAWWWRHEWSIAAYRAIAVLSGAAVCALMMFIMLALLGAASSPSLVPIYVGSATVGGGLASVIPTSDAIARRRRKGDNSIGL